MYLDNHFICDRRDIKINFETKNIINKWLVLNT